MVNWWVYGFTGSSLFFVYIVSFTHLIGFQSSNYHLCFSEPSVSLYSLSNLALNSVGHHSRLILHSHFQLWVALFILKCTINAF